MEDTKKKIIDSAKEQFALYGYKKTSLNDIVQSINIGKSAIYNYFKNKEDLFRQVLLLTYSDAFETLTSMVNEETDPLKKLVKYALARTEYCRTLFFEVRGNISVLKELSDARDKIESSSLLEIGILEEIFKDGELKGKFKTNSSKHAPMIYKILWVFESQWLSMEPKKCNDEIEELFEILLQGICA
jgi:AcrR family transcriptional regulator